MEVDFSDLYSKYFSRVYKLCLYHIKNPEIALDITQDTFLCAYEKIHTLKDEKAFYSWCKTIATNLIYNLQTRELKRYLPLNDDFDYKVEDAKSVEDYVTDALHIKELQEAISLLPQVSKEVFYLKYYENCSIKEISALTGLPIGTVKSRLFRCRKYLCKKIKKQEPID